MAWGSEVGMARPEYTEAEGKFDGRDNDDPNFRNGGVLSMLEKNKKALAELQLMTTQLEERLGPVLMPEHTNPNMGSNGQDEKPMASHISEQLELQSMQILAVAMRLRYLTGRVHI